MTAHCVGTGGVNLFLWTKTSPWSEMMRSCNRFLREKMLTFTLDLVTSGIMRNAIISKCCFWATGF